MMNVDLCLPLDPLADGLYTSGFEVVQVLTNVDGIAPGYNL